MVWIGLVVSILMMASAFVIRKPINNTLFGEGLIILIGCVILLCVANMPFREVIYSQEFKLSEVSLVCDENVISEGSVFIVDDEHYLVYYKDLDTVKSKLVGSNATFVTEEVSSTAPYMIENVCKESDMDRKLTKILLFYDKSESVERTYEIHIQP